LADVPARRIVLSKDDPHHNENVLRPATNRRISDATQWHHDVERVLAVISDPGPSIPEYKLKKVFEPFYTSKSGGMGMGLSIARTIIEAHHGLTWAKNRDHGGATFRIRLSLV